MEQKKVSLSKQNGHEKFAINCSRVLSFCFSNLNLTILRHTFI